MSRDAVLLGGVLLAAAVNMLLWLFTIPFQHGPDEGAHFQVVRFIRDFGRLPLFDPTELWLIRTPSGAIETYAAFPPLAYIVGALFARLAPAEAMWAARVASLAACLGAVVVTYMLTRRLMPANRSVAVGAALLIAFVPQFAFTAAYVNNDALPVFLSAVLYLLLLRAFTNGPTVARYAGIGVVIGALLLTKYTFYAAALVSFGAALVLARDVRRYALAALVLPLATAVTAGWWFVRNWQLYGEVIPSKTVAAAKASAGGNTLFVPADHGINLLTVSTQTDFWAVTLRSFVATFGFLSIYLDGTFYVGALALGLLGGAGVVWHIHRTGLTPTTRAVALFGAGVTGGTTLAAMVISTYGEYSPQGRYLFAALVPLVILLAAGWYWLGARLLRWIPSVALAGFMALNQVSLLGYVVPREFGTPTEKITIEMDRPTAPQKVATEIEVLGWSFAEGAATWRPLDPAAVNAYRRPVSGVLIYLHGPPGEGTFQGTAHYGFRRRDVSEFYGDNRRLDPIGFRYVLPAGTLPAGEHYLYACALAPTVEVPTCMRRIVVVEG